MTTRKSWFLLGEGDCKKHKTPQTRRSFVKEILNQNQARDPWGSPCWGNGSLEIILNVV